MSRVKDITSIRYGRLLVIERAGSGTSGQARWLCRCDCGNEVVIDGYSLRAKKSTSCGCYRKEIKQDNRCNFYKHGRYGTRAYFASAASLRRARIRNQTAGKVRQDKIDLYYKIRDYLGPDWHVDHIKPIANGGRHHEDNLQIISATDNMKKHTNEDYIPEYSFRI